MNAQMKRPWMETDYPAVRRIMGSERERLDDEALEEMLGGLFPETDPADVEDFMRGLQRFGRQAAPLAQRALPGVIQGATTGATVAGPWGAVAGAVGGGIASLAGGGQPPSPAASPAPAAATTVPSAAPAPGEPAAPNAAAAQLLALLSRPETMQALLALLMSSSGRPAVRVGSQAVPAAAFANAISELAAETAAAFAGPALDGLSEYLRDDHGMPRVDVMNPAERAALLLEELAEVAREEEEEEDADEDEFAHLDEDHEAADPMDEYECAREGRSFHEY